MKKLLFLLVVVTMASVLFAQENLPTDYLTKEFHAGRREALRALMPVNSVAIVFAYPARIFSSDVSYPYHPNPDLYYFSGYKEPNSVLLIFKEPQKAPGGGTYRELFFIQRRDSLAESWNGRRLGVQRVKSELGFDSVYDGSAFKDYPIDFSSFSQLLFAASPEDGSVDLSDEGDLHYLLQAFKKKAGIPDTYDASTSQLIMDLVEVATPSNLARVQVYLKGERETKEKVRNNEWVTEFSAIKDSAGLTAFREKVSKMKWNPYQYARCIGMLREIKTREEMVLMRRTVSISCIAHAEVMKAIKPGMSEREIQGIQEFVHKKLGAEELGYPSIVGSGSNGCILHYEENNRVDIGRDMVLMDIGAAYHGYSADVTRTVPSTGKFNPEQKAVYDLVYQAQEAIFPLCREGTLFHQLNDKAKEVLTDGLLKLGIIKEKEQLPLYYPHSCSHFLGLDVHDVGGYDSLKENMVITVEPGIYIPAGSPCDKKWWNIGVRIEDDVRIGKNDHELLSWQAPRKSEEVEKMTAEKSVLNSWVLPAVR